MKRILVVILVAFFAGLLAAETAIYDSSSLIYTFLNVGVGARAAGMGEAFTAVADDASAVYWNPGGLALVKQPEIILTYDKWFVDTYYQYLVAAVPLHYGVLGLDIYYMNFGEFEQRDDYGFLLEDEVNPYNVGGAVAYAMKVYDWLCAGAGAKIIYESLGSDGNVGFAFDIGAIAIFGMFSLGFNIQDLGKTADYNVPINFNGGIAVKLLNLEKHTLLLAVNGEYLLNDVGIISVGAEYVWQKILSIRAGYKMRLEESGLEDITGISGGLGFDSGMLKIDYAIAPYGELGLTHRISATFKFGEITDQKPVEQRPVEKTVKQKPAEKAVKKPAAPEISRE